MKKYSLLLLVLFCSFSQIKAQSKPKHGYSKTNKPIPSKLKMVWSDEFNYSGLPDSTKWGYDVGGDGWGNNEAQFYTKADINNAVVNNGFLSIIARKEKHENKEYTSTRMITKGKKDWSFGRVDIKAKLPKGRGIWPAGWMLGSNINTVGWPQCGEVDILEHVGYDPDTIVGSIHSTAYNHKIGTQKTKRIFIKNPYTEFHIYGCEWNTEKLTFLLDGVPYLTVQNEHKDDKEYPFNNPMYILLNVAVGGNWGGTKGIDESIFPVRMEVDYVRVFQ
jgi:beta-glucanase (GH16 family)